MKISLLILVVIAILNAQPAKCATLDTWADNIRITEGIHSIYPYGIKIKDNKGEFKRFSPLEARIICKRTVWHKWRNYSKLPMKTRQAEDFITYLANIYCPKSDDPIGNLRWKLTMHKLMERKAKK